jgi:pyrroloquinoline quinone biosynthesis protein B
MLGTAAGGGYPQWNCWCPTCRVARTEPHRGIARRQSSAALSADGKRWFLLNASPDVREQLACLPDPDTDAVRHTPIEGVLTTDAELDHTLGITLLREARSLRLYLTPSVRSILERDSCILRVTRAFAEVTIQELALDTPTPLSYRDGQASSISVEPFVVTADPPRFASTNAVGHTVGFLIVDQSTGGSCAFIPGCGALDQPLLRKLEGVDLVLFDGTFWSDNELIELGISERQARDMDHLPVSGPDGSLARLAQLSRPRKVYTHINNTNPMLLEDSEERALVDRAGLTVAADGMRFTL